jgi:hypothetical protein
MDFVTLLKAKTHLMKELKAAGMDMLAKKALFV